MKEIKDPEKMYEYFEKYLEVYVHAAAVIQSMKEKTDPPSIEKISKWLKFKPLPREAIKLGKAIKEAGEFMQMVGKVGLLKN